VIGTTLTLLAGLTGVVLAKIFHIPGGAFTGAMFAAAAVRLNFHAPKEPPRPLQSLARIILGLTIGIGVDLAALRAISESFAAITIMIAVLIVLSFATAWAVTRMSGLPFITSVCGSAPGAASVMVVVAGDLHGDPPLVAMLHILRLSVIMITVPLVLTGFFLNSIPTPAVIEAANIAPPASLERFLKMAFLLAAGIPTALLFRYIKIPAAEIIAGIIIAALANPFLLHLDKLPALWQIFSQWIIGSAIGALITRQSLGIIKSYTFVGIIMTFILILIGFFLGLALYFTTEMSFLTAIIGSCPGAMEAMIILAGELNADVPLVAAMHTLRLIVVILVLPFIVRRTAGDRPR
jgi:hypothetical protein